MGVIKYINETRAELHHVAWPTRQQTIVYTALVVLVSIFVAAYVGFFDFLLTRSLEAVLTGSPIPTQQTTGTTTIPVDGGSLELNTNPGAGFNVEGVETAPTENSQ